MQSSNVDDRVRDVIARVAKIPRGFRGDADLYRDLGVKSGAALELLLSLEDEFGIAIPDDAFGDARSTDRLVALVTSLHGVDA
jgi:acyl carrier protein